MAETRNPGSGISRGSVHDRPVGSAGRAAIARKPLLNSCSADGVQLSVGGSQEKQELTFSPHFVNTIGRHVMSRDADFDILFDRLEAAIIKSRAMKLAPVTYRLLNALDEASYLLTSELHKRAAQERRFASQWVKRSATDCEG
jgi:hypothetical protein